MLGPEGVAVNVRARLLEDLPDRLDQVRDRYDIGVRDLPNPTAVEIVETDGASLDRFPLIIITPLQTDLDGGNSQYSSGGTFNAYEYRYHLGIWVWVRGRTSADTQLKQWRMTLAVRECLIARRGYGNPDGPDYQAIDPNRLHEAYSDVEQNPAKQWVAGTLMTAEFTTQEHLEAYQPPIGVQTSGPLGQVTAGQQP